MENQLAAHASDIGETGILVESSSPVRGHDVKILASAGDRKVISVEGRVVYSIRSGEGRYKAGIMFLGSDRENSAFAEELLAAYHRSRGPDAGEAEPTRPGHEAVG
jgi:hypothetical protein